MQCDKLYNAGTNFQCAVTQQEERMVRNHCEKHLVDVSKAKVQYVGRRESKSTKGWRDFKQAVRTASTVA